MLFRKNPPSRFKTLNRSCPGARELLVLLVVLIFCNKKCAIFDRPAYDGL